MKTRILACAVLLLLACFFAGAQTNAPIPWNQIGATAGANYRGDGLTVLATATGARLRCVFQRLDGEATREGLWLTSTVPDQPNDRFRVTAVAVGRQVNVGDEVTSLTLHPEHESEPPHVGCYEFKKIAAAGNVSVDGPTVRFARRGLIEEYSVSMDGVRQDFVVLKKPGGARVPHEPTRR